VAASRPVGDHLGVDRALDILAVALVTAGILILADVATTLLWKEPVSSLYAAVRQGDAGDQLAALEREFPDTADRRAIRGVRGSPRRARILAGRFAREVEEGQAIGRLVIPAIDLDIVAVQGTDTPDLEQGPGHYASTSMPGQPGTSAIAGHRTTYLAPFRHLDALDRGDRVRVEMPYAHLIYRVEGTQVIEPTDVQILDPAGGQRLVLTACHPLYSASQRIAAFARLARIGPVPPPAG
jgi:sortase A